MEVNQCQKIITKKKESQERCSRKTKGESKFCWQHNIENIKKDNTENTYNRDIFSYIFTVLKLPKSLKSFSCVNKLTYSIAKEIWIWEIIYKKEFDNLDNKLKTRLINVENLKNRGSNIYIRQYTHIRKIKKYFPNFSYELMIYNAIQAGCSRTASRQYIKRYVEANYKINSKDSKLANKISKLIKNKYITNTIRNPGCYNNSPKFDNICLYLNIIYIIFADTPCEANLNL